jgi:hypothetical protein
MTKKRHKTEKPSPVPEAIAEEKTPAPTPATEPQKEGETRGRPTKLTPEVRQKIEQAAALDATVKEICFYADISRETYYQWMKEDPAFSDRIEALRAKPMLKARETIVKSLEDPTHAFRYAEKKGGGEFNPAHKVEVVPPGENVDENDDVKRAIGVFEEAMRPVLTTPKGPMPLAKPPTEPTP